MKLLPSDPRFATVPQIFTSPFPSASALVSSKVAALKDGGLGEGVAVAQNLTAILHAAQIGAFEKAVHIGDFLSRDLLKISFAENGSWMGLFAKFAIQATTNPSTLGSNLAATALNIGLSVLSAVPVVGQILSVAVAAGRFLFGLASAKEPPPPVTVPLSEFSRDLDEDLVNLFLRPACQTVDWTPIFLPPFNPTTPWSRKLGDDKNTRVFGPFVGNDLDYAGGVGAIPGAFQLAGQLQQAAVSGLPHRWGVAGSYHHRIVTTDCGRFFPASAAFAAQLWQWVLKSGNPDQYKVATDTVDAQWAAYFDTFFSSCASLFNQANNDEDKRRIGNLIGAYLVSHSRVGKPPLFGVPALDRMWPSYPIVTPDFKAGLSGRPEHRHKCLYWLYTKEKLPNGTLYQQTFREPPGEPERNRDTTKCIAFPPVEASLLSWTDVYSGLVKPTIDFLKAEQKAGLRKSLVCAYVRPDPVNDLPPYVAFAADPELAQECRDAREILLGHPARFAVRLADVDDIDPAFAQRLRDSGVTNSASQFSQALSEDSIDEGLSPEVLPPVPADVSELVIPSDDDPDAGDDDPDAGEPDDKPQPKGSGGAGIAVAGAAVAVLGGIFAVSTKRKKRR